MRLASDFFLAYSLQFVWFFFTMCASCLRIVRKENCRAKREKKEYGVLMQGKQKKFALWSYFCRGICKKRGFISKHSTFVAFYGIAQQQISSNCSKKTKAKQQDQKEILLIFIPWTLTKKNNDPIPEKENRKRLHRDGTALNIIRLQFPQETECKRILTVITLAWKNFLHTVNAIPELFMHWTESVRAIFGLFFLANSEKHVAKI